MIELKCFTCAFYCHHSPGNFSDVAVGHDDPYSYSYCKKGHHGGGHEMEPEPDVDPWVNCPDYQGGPGKQYLNDLKKDKK